MGKAAMETEENLLLAEIEFWRYMIESRRGAISEQASQRMLDACELAERKLMMMERASSRVETMNDKEYEYGATDYEKYHAPGG